MLMSKRLYIGNLCSTTTKAALTEAFQQDGRQVSNVELVMSREAPAVRNARGNPTMPSAL